MSRYIEFKVIGGDYNNMRKILKIELERAFKNKYFFICILIETIIIAIYSVSNLYPAITKTIPYFSQYMGTKLDFLPGALYYWLPFRNLPYRILFYGCLPILAAIPYSTVMYKDMSTSYSNQYFIRTKKSYFYFSKLIVTFLSGGVVATFPFAASLYINLMILPVENASHFNGYFSVLYEKVFLSVLCVFSPIIDCLVYLVLTFVAFGVINCISFILTFCLSNGFVIKISPFCVFFMTFAMSNFMPKNALLWNYVLFYRINKTDFWLGSIQLVVIVIIAVLIAAFKSRKERDQL